MAAKNKLTLCIFQKSSLPLFKKSCGTELTSHSTAFICIVKQPTPRVHQCLIWNLSSSQTCKSMIQPGCRRVNSYSSKECLHCTKKKRFSSIFGVNILFFGRIPSAHDLCHCVSAVFVHSLSSEGPTKTVHYYSCLVRPSSAETRVKQSLQALFRKQN